MFTIEDIYKAGIALGALSLLVFFLGHLGLISPPFLAASCLLAGGLFYLSIRKRRVYGQPAPCFSLFHLALIAITVILVLVLLPLALTPPAVRDELIQHLAVPRLYLEKGRIYEITSMGFSYLPQNIDLLYMVPLAFGSDIAPRLVHMAFAVLTGLLVYFYLLPGSGRSYALLGLFLYLATPLVANLSTLAYIDHGSAFFSTLALIGALKWREEGFALKWLVYSAISMGFALGSKYNAAISIMLVGLFVVYSYARDRRDFAGAVRAGLLYGVIAVVIFSPWLVRNYVWKGSPFYPLWESAVHAAAKGEGFHVTSEMAPVGKRFLLYGEGALDLILLPLRLFWEGTDNSIQRFDGVLNPFFLVFIPLAFIRKRRGDGALGFLALFSVLFFIFAFLTADLVTRYLMPVIPLLIIMVTIGFRNLVETKKLRLLAAALLAALLVFDAAYITGLYRRHSPLPYLLGAQTREQYLSKRLPDYAVVNYANGVLPKGAKVMLLFSGDRGYYWNAEYVYGERTGTFLLGYVRGAKDGEALKQRFTAQGITHLFINDRLTEKFLNDNFTRAELAVVVDFFNKHAARLYGANGFSIYALR